VGKAHIDLTQTAYGYGCLRPESGGIMVFLTKDQKVTVLFIILFIFSAIAGFVWGSYLTNPPEYKPFAVSGSPASTANPTVSKDTVLFREKLYLCGDTEVLSRETVPGNMVGMDRNAVIEMFPASEGWIVSFNDPRFLTLTVKYDELCQVHRNYRHLGHHQGKAAVYEGPIGYHGKMLRVENINIESLEPALQTKLEQVMSLDQQTPLTIEELRREIEFASEELLNAFLENLDESS